MFQYIGIIPADLPLDDINDIVGYQDVFVKANDNKEFFGLEINGNSMYPDFKDKDHVIFIKQSDCNSGQDCAVIIDDNNATLQKIIKQENGLLLQSLNPEFEPIFYPSKDVSKHIRILGIAYQLIRQLDCND